MQHTSYANRGGMRIYRPWQKIPYHREYEDVLAEHSRRLWPESMPTCFQAVPISSLTNDPATQEEIFKECYPKASMEPACFKIIHPIASEATAQAAVLEAEPGSKELVEPKSKELVEPKSKEPEAGRSKTLVDLHDVIKPFGSIMTQYQEPKQSSTNPRSKFNQKTPKLHPYNFKTADTTMRCDPIRGRVKPADPTRKLYNDGSIVAVKPAGLKSKVLKPPMVISDPTRGREKVKLAGPKLHKPNDPQSKMLKPAMMASDIIRGKAKPAVPNMHNNGLIAPVKPAADTKTKPLNSAMMRSDPTRGKVKPADPKSYNRELVVPVKPTEPHPKLLKPAMSRPDPIRVAEPTRKLYSDGSTAKLHPYNFKSTHTTRFDPIRGKIKPVDPTKKLYNHGMIVPVKAAVQRPEVHIDRAKIAYLKHITVPRLQPYSRSTSTSAINSAGPMLVRKRKYEPITTSPDDNHIVKKRI